MNDPAILFRLLCLREQQQRSDRDAGSYPLHFGHLSEVTLLGNAISPLKVPCAASRRTVRKKRHRAAPARGKKPAQYQSEVLLISVHPSIIRAIAPVPVGESSELRCALELVLSHVHAITAKLGVVLQIAPRQRIVILAYAHESAERDHGVSDLTADLVNHPR